mmetsp:Transcript_6821/g.18431  ORF Transcript_6821/g.18431 Transcript_6821/m.18431 type:complete len:151 (+) Transcript_6821:462-914(+)
MGKGGAASLLELLDRALRCVDEDDRGSVYRRVILHGEGALIRGVDSRLTNELRRSPLISGVACVRPSVAQSAPGRAHEAAWSGASKLLLVDELASASRARETSPWLDSQVLAQKPRTGGVLVCSSCCSCTRSKHTSSSEFPDTAHTAHVS